MNARTPEQTTARLQKLYDLQRRVADAIERREWGVWGGQLLEDGQPDATRLMRAWAVANGYAVGLVGTIPIRVRQAYEEAHAC